MRKKRLLLTHVLISIIVQFLVIGISVYFYYKKSDYSIAVVNLRDIYIWVIVASIINIIGMIINLLNFFETAYVNMFMCLLSIAIFFGGGTFFKLYITEKTYLKIILFCVFIIVITIRNNFLCKMIIYYRSSDLLINTYNRANYYFEKFLNRIDKLNSLNESFTKERISFVKTDADRKKISKKQEKYYLGKDMYEVENVPSIPPKIEIYMPLGKSIVIEYEQQVLQYCKKINKSYSDKKVKKKLDKLSRDKEVFQSKWDYLNKPIEIENSTNLPKEKIEKSREQRAKDVDKYDTRAFFDKIRKNRKI